MDPEQQEAFEEREKQRVAIRQMVLDFTVTKAHEVVNATKEAGLTDGWLSDHMEVEGGGWWCLQIAYFSKHEQVSISGHLHQPNPFMQMLQGHADEAGHPLLIFGSVEGQRDGFQYTLPVAWLPALAADPRA